MKIFNAKHFFELSNKHGDLVVSIYTPTNRHSSDGYKEDKTHLKNSLAKAESDLINTYGLSSQKAKDFLKEGRQLLEAHEFWKHSADMLATFVIDGKLEFVRLPINITESHYFISNRPLMLPMIEELNDDGHYYLLSLNLDQIRLYEGTRNTFREIELDPEAVATSFTAEEKEMENQSNLQAQGGFGKAGAMFHGQGDGSDEIKKKTISNYFDRMSNMLEPLINQNPLPLYLAGVDYLIPIFRSSSKYGNVMDGHISGSFNGEDSQKLHQEVWKMAEPYFMKERHARKAMYDEKSSKGLGISNDVLNIVKASLNGAIDTLLVNKQHKHLRGKYDSKLHQVNLSKAEDSLDHCLVDEAAVACLAQKGKVYLVNADDMPNNAPMAATLRYALG